MAGFAVFILLRIFSVYLVLILAPFLPHFIIVYLLDFKGKMIAISNLLPVLVSYYQKPIPA